MNWNTNLFELINAGPHPGAATVLGATLAASASVPIAALVALVLWIRGDRRRRGALLAVGLAISLALMLNLVLGAVWFEPRPFIIGLGRNLMSHVADNSFPSDHATFLWSMGFAMIATGASRRWGIVVSASGVLTAWARIYLGVHFPVDMLGSGVVSLFSAALARLVQPFLAEWPLSVVERTYERVLMALRLPTSLFPRSDK